MQKKLLHKNVSAAFLSMLVLCVAAISLATQGLAQGEVYRPPNPVMDYVPQNVGIYDTYYQNFHESDCRECHGASTAVRHHNTEPAMMGNCLYSQGGCHDSGFPGYIARDCQMCHTSDPNVYPEFYAVWGDLGNPHHKTDLANTGQCNDCHDPNLVVEAYSVPPPIYAPGRTTPTPASCENCHWPSGSAPHHPPDLTDWALWTGYPVPSHFPDGTPNPQPIEANGPMNSGGSFLNPAKAYPPNDGTHHEINGMVYPQCALCHWSEPGNQWDTNPYNPQAIRFCENCHTVEQLHAIPEHVNTNNIYTINGVPNQEVTGSEKCMACHGNAPTASQWAQWARIYGGINGDDFRSIQQTADGGYIVAGSTVSFSAEDYYDGWVLKLNTDGSIAWQKTYGGEDDDDFADSIKQTADGGYIVAGITYSFGSPYHSNLWILKLGTNGNVLWQKAYGVTNDVDDVRYSQIQQTSDGGYIVVGYYYYLDYSDSDVWLLKLNPDGSIAWQKTYGGSNFDFGTSVQQTVDGGYIVAANSSSFSGGGSSDYGIWVLKLNTDGSIAWQKIYTGERYAQGGSIQQTQDGGYVVAGEIRFIDDSLGSGYWVLKLNSDGTIAWQKTYSSIYTYYFPTTFSQTSDGGYIMAGRRQSSGETQLNILKLTPNGTIAWQKTYGGSNFDNISSIQETADGSYIGAGGTFSFSGNGAEDAWILKLNTNGEIPYCSIMGSSNAIEGITNITGIDTDVVGIDTTVSPLTSTASAVDINAIVTEVCYYEPPIVGYSPTSFSFTATQGGSSPSDQTLSITNTGGGTLNWSVSDDAAWLSLNPTSGTNSGTVTVSVNIAGLIAGTYNATITITATDATNSPVSIPVTLTINAPPAIVLLAPNGGEIIPSGSTYTIRWSAPPEAVKFTLKYSINNGSTWKTIATNRTGTSYNWHVPTPSNNKTTCLVKVIGFNSSGIKVGEDISDSTFTIEVVKVTSPDGGEILKSGTTWPITWLTNGTIRTVVSVKLFRTMNSGSTWTLIKTLTVNPGSYNWKVPLVTVPKTQCKVKVVLKDSGGVTVGSDISDAFFTIQP